MSYKELAELFKTRENLPWMGVIVGEVVTAPPELQVKIHDKITLEKNKIVVSWEKVKGYNRAYSLSGEIEQSMTVDGSQLTGEGSRDDTTHNTHKLESWEGSGSYTATGTITWEDELEEGDKVILIPTINQELFYLVDKIYMYE
jgi:hypothetical protein